MMSRMMDIRKKVKEWMLPLAMLAGASLYLIYHELPEPVHRAGPYLETLVGLVQPFLIFAMLFLTFCRIEPKELKPHRWHWWLLLIQGGSFTVLGLTAWLLAKYLPSGSGDWTVLIESAMLCMICPTATAAAVVTRKLGGDVPGITTYVVLINLLTAILVPLIVPLVRPMEGMGFWTAFCMIVARIFPLFILPCLFAWMVRYMAPRIYRRIQKYPDLAFYLWAIALTFAIAVTVRSIVRSVLSLRILLFMSVISLVCCVIQFAAGRYIGGCYNPREMKKITAGQSLGQKNTVFAIWMAYTFMTPETAIVGGLYSIWHNIYNSWQLRRAMK